MENFTNGLLNIVQDQSKLFSLTYDELINAISGYFYNDDSNPVAEITAPENSGDGVDVATTDPQLFKFDEF